MSGFVVIQNGQRYEIPVEVEAQGGAAIAAYIAAQHTPAAPAKSKE